MVKIFVGRLTEKVKKSDLEELFKGFGEVTDCSIVKNYGFVHMADMDEAKAAIAGLDKHELDGNAINVELSTTKVTKATKLFIGNLPPDTKSCDVHKLFKKYGTVIECDVVKNYAFVHMSRESMARDAIEGLNNTTFNGNKIAVQMSRTKRGDDGASGMVFGDFRGRGMPRGRGRGFMSGMRGGPPRFRGKPFGEDLFLEPPFGRRPALRPRLPQSLADRGIGAMYDNDLIARGALRRGSLLGSGDSYLLREREALARRLDAEAFIAESYRGATGAGDFDFASDLTATDFALDRYGGSLSRYDRLAADRYAAVADEFASRYGDY